MAAGKPTSAVARKPVAIITGASQGIGASTAKELAAHGYAVALMARSMNRLEALCSQIEASGGHALALRCDVSDYEQVVASVTQAAKHFGGLDVLVNNAGVIDPIARLDESDPTQWHRAIDVNLKGVYNGVHASLPLMLKQQSGVIINISSGAATNALEGWSHYCASKAAVLSLTRCIHKEYANQGIRCVGLSPGTVDTPMQVAIRDSGVNPVSQLDPAVHIPPDWPARAIAWLCTTAATAYDGGDFSIKTDEGRRLVGLID